MIERVPVMSLPQMSPQCLSLVATKASFTCLGGPVERVIRRHELTQMSAGIIPALDPTELFHRPRCVPYLDHAMSFADVRKAERGPVGLIRVMLPNREHILHVWTSGVVAGCGGVVSCTF